MIGSRGEEEERKFSSAGIIIKLFVNLGFKKLVT